MKSQEYSSSSRELQPEDDQALDEWLALSISECGLVDKQVDPSRPGLLASQWKCDLLQKGCVTRRPSKSGSGQPTGQNSNCIDSGGEILSKNSLVVKIL